MLIILFYNPLHHHHPFPHNHITQKIFHRHLIHFFIQHILFVSVCLEILRYKRHYLYLSRRKTHQEMTDNCDISAIIKLLRGVGCQWWLGTRDVEAINTYTVNVYEAINTYTVNTPTWQQRQ